MPSYLEDAAALICRHFPRAERGPIWDRVRKVAARRPVTRGFLRTAERRQRIDEWRTRTRARGGREDLRVEFVSLDEIRFGELPAPVEVYPEQFMRVVLEACDARERAVVWCVWVDDMDQRELGRVLGLTESRISQLVRETRQKILHRIHRSYPGLEAEWR